MSIHSAVNYQFGYEQEPSWMKSERYDYCEPFYTIVESKSWLEKLIAFFS